MDNIVEHYRQQFQRAKPHLVDIAQVNDHRDRALAQLTHLGFPTRRVEDWKYINLQEFAQQPFTLLEKTQAQQHAAVAELANCSRIVIQDGCYRETLSTLPTQALITITDLATAIAEAPEKMIHTMQQSESETQAFAALNNAFTQHGIVIHLARNAILDKPLVIDNIVTQAQFAPIKIIIIAEDNSQAQIIEHYVGQVKNYFVNTQTYCQLAQSAQLEHYKIIREQENSFHIGQTTTQQYKDSCFKSFVFALSGGLVRSDCKAVLAESGASVELYGATVTQGKQIVDHHTEIHHTAANTHSVENYKGIANGQSRLVFNGKVRVEQDAQRITCEQQNKNLLLSKQAEIDSKPELEIFADDVKCSHGAAIGELDQDALFYLRSRGISSAQAKQLLLHAFIDEILDKIGLDECRDLLQREMEQQLAALEME